MYIHLGLDVMVNAEHITGIFDLENTTTSKHTREFLKQAEATAKVINVVTDIPKSFVVVTDKKGKTVVYITQLSSATLAKRMKAGDEMGNR